MFCSTSITFAVSSLKWFFLGYFLFIFFIIFLSTKQYLGIFVRYGVYVGTEGTGKAFAKETNLFTFLVENGQEFQNQPEI